MMNTVKLETAYTAYLNRLLRNSRFSDDFKAYLLDNGGFSPFYSEDRYWCYYIVWYWWWQEEEEDELFYARLRAQAVDEHEEQLAQLPDDLRDWARMHSLFIPEDPLIDDVLIEDPSYSPLNRDMHDTFRLSKSFEQHSDEVTEEALFYKKMNPPRKLRPRWKHWVWGWWLNYLRRIGRWYQTRYWLVDRWWYRLFVPVTPFWVLPAEKFLFLFGPARLLVSPAVGLYSRASWLPYVYWSKYCRFPLLQLRTLCLRSWRSFSNFWMRFFGWSLGFDEVDRSFNVFAVLAAVFIFSVVFVVIISVGVFPMHFLMLFGGVYWVAFSAFGVLTFRGWVFWVVFWFVFFFFFW